MESVLELLESNENNWSMNFDRYNSFIDVSESFGYDFKTQKNTHDVQEFLKEKIKNTLYGDKLSQVDFEKLQDHLALRYFSSAEVECKNAFKFVGLIRYVINRLESYSASLESWFLVRDYLEAYLCLSNYSHDQNSYSSLYNEKKLISKSILFLNKKGFKTTIEAGNVVLSGDSEDRLLQAISYRFKKLGYHSIHLTLDCISRHYNNDTKRYFLRPEPSISLDYSADIPWGYLFNVSLANLHNAKNVKRPDKIFLECVELSKHYFCVKNLQTLNKFSDINHRYDTILPAIQKHILYDQYFSIDQVKSDHIIEMIEGMFTSSLIDSLSVNLRIYIDVLKWVSYKSKHNEPLVFSADEIFHAFNYKHLVKDIEDALLFMSFQTNEVNTSYLKPDEISKRNYFEKPFVKVDSKYLYVNPIICNYGFYNCLLELCKSSGADGNLIGKKAEELVEKLLDRSGVKFHSNKEYKVPKFVSKELCIQSQKRECDFIIETNDTIIIVELKRKTLTSEARAGDTLRSIIDLSQSFLHALAQTGCHEYMLRRNGKIEFDDGSIIELSGRKVERVALSLFGFFGIQDGSFIHQVLGSLINAKIDSGSVEEDIKINKQLTELRNQYRTDIFVNLYCEGSNPFFNCRFFSVPQFIEILSNTTNNEQFELELNRTRHVSTGCKDWFKEYQFVRKLKA
ncbi:MAG: hypothetical protein JXQ95_04420 [Alteromonas stellipolaris]|uniref:hypothetical protein n=1 Tax=Alteromonas stellipolaris TaxID=233316 RepID=UPI003B8E3ABA